MKKGAKVVNIIIAMSVMTILILAFIYIRLYTAGTLDPGFNPDKISEATQLYDEIIGFNYITDYPQTPEEVMELYLKTVRILYGDLLRSDEYMRDIIEKQRTLLGEDILRLNSLDDQFTKFKEQYDTLMRMGVITIRLEQKAPIFPTPERDVCTIRVTKFNMGSGVRNTYLVYTLSSDNTTGRWKVISWEVTDANFNPL